MPLDPGVREPPLLCGEPEVGEPLPLDAEGLDPEGDELDPELLPELRVLSTVDWT